MKKRLLNLMVIIAATLFFIPIISTVILSFSDENGSLTLYNYADLLFNCFIFYPMFWNSVLYATVITILQLVVIIPCAFGFVNARFRLKGILLIIYIILMMMPLQVTLLPNYIGLREMSLLDTRLSIILPMMFSPFGVVVMHQYMKNINQSTIEALRLETNSIIRIIISGVISQIKPCIYAVALFVFADCWNMLEQPMLFINNNELQTLSVFISTSEIYDGNVLLPAAVIFIIPVFLLFTVFHNSLEKGLNFGELK